MFVRLQCLLSFLCVLKQSKRFKQNDEEKEEEEICDAHTE